MTHKEVRVQQLTWSGLTQPHLSTPLTGSGLAAIDVLMRPSSQSPRPVQLCVQPASNQHPSSEAWEKPTSASARPTLVVEHVPAGLNLRHTQQNRNAAGNICCAVVQNPEWGFPPGCSTCVPALRTRTAFVGSVGLLAIPHSKQQGSAVAA